MVKTAKKRTLTTAKRREQLFSALERMRFSLDKAAYLQGCRASNPAKHDTPDVRAREQAHYSDASSAQGEAVAIFNRAVSAASRKARVGW